MTRTGLPTAKGEIGFSPQHSITIPSQHVLFLSRLLVRISQSEKMTILFLSLFVFAVLNSEDTATTSGFSELFADGAAMFGELRLPMQFFGRSGHQMFGGSWISRTFTSLNQSQRLKLPDIAIAEKEGSWALYWNSNQFLWQDPCDSDRSWGVFGRAGISDGNPNPVQWLLSFGVGGSSPLSGRRDDSFGVGWYYTGISDELGPVVSGLLNHGQGIELY